LHQEGEGVAKDEAKAKDLYAKCCLALGDKPSSVAFLKQGCEMKDAWACDLQKRLK
jgi:hypothetical protein